MFLFSLSHQKTCTVVWHWNRTEQKIKHKWMVIWFLCKLLNTIPCKSLYELPYVCEEYIFVSSRAEPSSHSEDFSMVGIQRVEGATTPQENCYWIRFFHHLRPWRKNSDMGQICRWVSPLERNVLDKCSRVERAVTCYCFIITFYRRRYYFCRMPRIKFRFFLSHGPWDGSESTTESEIWKRREPYRRRGLEIDRKCRLDQKRMFIPAKEKKFNDFYILLTDVRNAD